METNLIKASNQWKKKIALFITSQAISLFGSSLVQFAVVWYITLETGSGLMVSLIGICGFAPQIFISLFAGVWADRYNRKMLIMVADGMIAFATLILALLFLFGIDHIWLLFVVSAIRSVGSGIQTPATNAILPQIVPEDKLMKVSGITQTIHSITFLISPAVSGAILGSMGLVAIFFIDVVTALMAIGVLIFIKVKQHEGQINKSQMGYFSDMKAGIVYIKNHKFLASLLVFSGLFMFLITPVAFLSPLMVAREWGKEVWRLTANEMLFSVGTMIGGIIVSVWGGFKNRIKTFGYASILFGFLTVITGLVPIFIPIFILFLTVVMLSGVVVPFFGSTSMVIVQESVEESMLGRVFSVSQIISTTALPLGMVLFGPLADLVSIQVLCAITGCIMILLGIYCFYNKSFKHIPHRTEKSDMQTTEIELEVSTKEKIES